jgi:hypothetical protein
MSIINSYSFDRNEHIYLRKEDESLGRHDKEIHSNHYQSLPLKCSKDGHIVLVERNLFQEVYSGLKLALQLINISSSLNLA